MAAPLKISRLQLSVRPSVGIAMSRYHALDRVTLLKHADAAMYRAKQWKSGYTFFDDGIAPAGDAVTARAAEQARAAQRPT